MQAELLGLPEVGKSTYLCAVALAAEMPDPTQLSKHSLTGDYHWVNTGIDALRSCDPVERTEQASQDAFKMALRNQQDSVIELTVPDLSGEVVRTAMNRRGWPEDLAERVRRADALAVMISADRFEPPITLREALRVVQAAGGAPDHGGEHADAEFITEHAPTAAKLLDLLRTVQFLREGRRTPLALLIAAWDVVEPSITGKPEITPERWLKSKLPLIDQYLRHQNHLELRVFGVSSQGGSFTDPESKRRLLERRAEERFVLAEGETRSIDLTAPLAWLLNTADN